MIKTHQKYFDFQREETFNIAARTKGKNSRSYIPTEPPRLPKILQTYTRQVKTAPISALDYRKEEIHYSKKLSNDRRFRIRKLVGSTNRWRLPSHLGSDLLGISQAVKAVPTENLSVPKHFENDGTNDEEKTVQLFSDSRPESAETIGSNTMNPQESSHYKKRKNSIPKRLINVASENISRPTTPFDATDFGPIDCLLVCGGIEWCIHSKAAMRSHVLRRLFTARATSASRSRTPLRQQQFVEVVFVCDFSEKMRFSDDLTRDVSSAFLNNLTKLKLKINENFSKSGMSITLGNLYLKEFSVRSEEVADVLPVAKFLEFRGLEKRCRQIIQESISSKNVTQFYAIANKYQLSKVMVQCVRWLCFNMIPLLSHEIQLRNVPFELLLEIIQSQNFFVESEYSVYQMLCCWLFLQLQPKAQTVPAFSTIITYFHSLPKWCGFLEREEGQQYSPLFSSLRIHGIQDSGEIEIIQKMNILPNSWIMRLITLNYRALQTGGEMSFLLSFESSSIRNGLVVKKEMKCSEIVQICGIYFEIVVSPEQQTSPSAFRIFLRRLKPSDPILAMGSKERSTFSLKPDREVQYSIRANWNSENEQMHFETGIRRQRFGFHDKLAMSEFYSVDGVTLPLYVTFSILFPSV